MTTTARATLPLLHRFLGIGILVLSATFAVLRYFEIGPVLPEGRVSFVLACLLSAIGVVLATITVLVVKPRVPDRAAGQPVEQYWATPAVGMRVVNVWFLLEGAGTLAAIGYYLTGQPVAAIATGLLLMVFWTCGPNAFAKA